jgi:hypothetical protein
MIAVSIMLASGPALAAPSREQCLAAATPPVLDPDRSPFEGAHRLTEAELSTLLIAHFLREVSRQPPHANDVDYLEKFAPDGRWTSAGGRTWRQGSYTIRGGRLCVDRGKPEASTRCRIVWRDRGGHYFTVEPAARGLRIEPVAIEALAPGAPLPFWVLWSLYADATGRPGPPRGLQAAGQRGRQASAGEGNFHPSRPPPGSAFRRRANGCSRPIAEVDTTA